MASNGSKSSQDDDRFRVYEADSRDLVSTLKSKFNPDELDELVTATITSPPYADIKDYGYEDQIGAGDSYDQYLDDLRKVFKEVYDITKPEGSLWINVNNRRVGGRIVSLQQDIVRVLENLEGISECPKCGDRVRRNDETGELYCTNITEHEDDDEWRHDPTTESWTFQNEIIWDKQKSNDERTGVRNVFEYVLVFRKTDEYTPNPDARIYDPEELKEWWVTDTYNYSPDGAEYANVWDIPAELTGGWAGNDRVEHEAVFPAQLVERMVNIATKPGDVILDPFAGTGTTLAVGEFMDRRTLGFELNPDYIDIYPDRKESVEAELQRGENGYASLENRKQRYQQATWGLRHHNYIKWYMTTLRKQIRTLAETYQLWIELGDHIDTTWATEHDTVLPVAINEALASSTPITQLLTAARDGNSATGDIDPEQLVAPLFEPLDTRAIVTNLLTYLEREDLQGDIFANIPHAELQTLVENGNHEALAKLVIEKANSASHALVEIASKVDAETVRNAVTSATSNSQATLTAYETSNDETDDDRDQNIVLAGALAVAVVEALKAASETDPRAIEPIIDPYLRDGALCGVRAAILDPETTFGVPPNGEDTVPVTAYLLVDPAIVHDNADAYQRAFEYITKSLNTSNAKKLEKHDLEVKPHWLTPEEMDDIVTSEDWSDRQYYLYKGRPERYAHKFDFDGHLWNRCLGDLEQWSEEYCSRSTPAIISPLRLDIQKVTEPDRKRYTINRVNDYVRTGDENDEEDGFTPALF